MARVLQTIEQPGGGTAEHVLQLTRGLVALGHQVEIASTSDNQINGALEAEGVTVHEIPFVGAIVAPSDDLRCLRRLVSLLRSGEFDVAHGHGAKAGVLTRLAGLIARVPVVYSPHQFAFVANEFRPLRHPRFRRAVTVWIERLFGLITARLVCVSKFELDQAAHERISFPARRRLIYHGVEINPGDDLDPALVDWRGEAILVGSVSALRAEKGLEFLVEAAADPRFDSASVKFAIVGDGVERDRLESMISDLGLEDKARVFPYSGAVEPHLRTLDIFVLASHLYEVLSIGTVEAMACGLPVVASAVGGVPEVVADGENGTLVPPANPTAIADALIPLVSDASLRERMGKRSEEIAGHKFTMDRMISETEALYLELTRA